MISKFEQDFFDSPEEELTLSALGLHSIITQRVVPTIEQLPSDNPELINPHHTAQGEA